MLVCGCVNDVNTITVCNPVRVFCYCGFRLRFKQNNMCLRLGQFSGHSMFLKAINNVLMINGYVSVLSPWLLTNTQTIAINTEQTHNMGHSMFLKAINNVHMINGCVLLLPPWLLHTQTIAINTEQTHDM